MGNPTGSDVHIDGFISDMAINYRPTGHIADKIFPVVGVAKESDAYAVWDKGDWFRIEDSKRARGDEANIVELNVSSERYFAQNYALAARVFKEDQANSDLGWGTALADKAMIPTTKLKQDWDRRVASMVTSLSNVASGTIVLSANQWGTSDSATPFASIMQQVEWLTDHSGYRPNRMVFGLKAWSLFRRTPEVQDLLFPHGGGVATLENAKNLLEMDEILVGRGHYNTANEGQTASLSEIWGPNVLLYYAPMTPKVDEPSFGYTFRWEIDGLPQMQAMVHEYETKRRAQSVEVQMYQDEKITASDLGYLFTTVDGST